MLLPASMLLLLLSATAPTQDEPSDRDAHPGDHAAPGASGLLGDYDASREASGTSWQPGSVPMEGFHFAGGSFDFMLHGFFTLGYQSEPEPRGVSDSFTTSMFMLSARRGAGSGTLGLRVMASVEPVMGSSGYPLLLQTGETSDGRTPLLDRQHPHDVLMETAIVYSRPVSRDSSLFVYFAPVGEPALGPTVFMRRLSSGSNPLAPIGHHWMDATHISYGVLTMGWNASNRAKVEISAFNGREPDEQRWNVEPFALNSVAMRFTANPSPNWSLQASLAQLDEPEILHPGIDVLRFTSSLTYNRPLASGNWQTTAVWGRNKRERTVIAADPATVALHTHLSVENGVLVSPGLVQNALLVESALRLRDVHTAFGRFEWAEKDELFPVADRRHSLLYDVKKLHVGYAFDFLRATRFRLSAGAALAAHFLPSDLDVAYGERPISSSFFLRVDLR